MIAPVDVPAATLVEQPRRLNHVRRAETLALCSPNLRVGPRAAGGPVRLASDVENIEENELLDAASVGTSAHASIPGVLVDAPQTSTIGGGEAKRHQSLQIAVPQCIAEGMKRRAQRNR